MELHGTPFRTVYQHPAAHLGGYIGLAFTAVLALVAFAFNVWFGIALVAVTGIGFGMLEITRRADRLALYEDGVAREYRLISTTRTFAEYAAIQDLEIRQGVVERLFGIGTLHINTAGSHGQEIVFPGIKDCDVLEGELRLRMRPHPIDTPAS